MTTNFRITAVQAAAVNLGTPLSEFEDDVRRQIAAEPTTAMLVYPELHLFNAPASGDDERNAALRASAVALDGDLAKGLCGIAREHGIWFVPGSLVENGPDDHIFNTAIVINPAGEVVATYRKMFPWRPYEPYTPGTEFTVFDVDGVGRFGLNICYDAWFPEVSRSLGWMGADIILNVVKTTTPDRAQEVVLARANAIVNQTYVVSVNTAGPVGFGHSIITGPEGEVLDELPGTAEGRLVVDFTRERVEHVRANGTAGTNRMWDQFHVGDAPIPLPIYAGRIDPSTWAPVRTTNH